LVKIYKLIYFFILVFAVFLKKPCMVIQAHSSCRKTFMNRKNKTMHGNPSFLRCKKCVCVYNYRRTNTKKKSILPGNLSKKPISSLIAFTCGIYHIILRIKLSTYVHGILRYWINKYKYITLFYTFFLDWFWWLINMIFHYSGSSNDYKLKSFYI